MNDPLRARTFPEGRPVVEALEVLAEETARLALIAGRFDQVIPEILGQLPEAGGAVLHELQSIDTLHQYLVETSTALARMVELVDPETLIDVDALATPARLEYFRVRLRGENKPTEEDTDTNSIQLF